MFRGVIIHLPKGLPFLCTGVTAKRKHRSGKVCISIATCRLPAVNTDFVLFRANGSFFHHKQLKQERLGFQRCYNKSHCVETLSKTPKRARFQDKEHLTHRKLSGGAIWCLVALSLLSLQLGQQTPQYPGLMLHGLLHSTQPGTDHLSQACQDTKVHVHQSWVWIPQTWVQRWWHLPFCCSENFSTATLSSRN